MASREELKRKLKASDRRRQRRPQAAADHVATPRAASLDVSGLIAETILAHVNASASQVRDAGVIAALRCCLNGSRPANDDVARLWTQLQDISSRDGVDARAFRASVSDVLDLAAEHHDPRNASAFLRYLTLLAD
jgi:hypothetical protein